MDCETEIADDAHVMATRLTVTAVGCYGRIATGVNVVTMRACQMA